MNSEHANTIDVLPGDAVREAAGAGTPRLPPLRARREDAWHDALPRIPAPECGAGRGFGGRTLRVGLESGPAALSFDEPAGSAATELIELQGAEMLLALSPPRGGPASEFDWREYAGVSRVLAFAIVHAELLEALERALGTPLVAAWCHARLDARRIDGGLLLGYTLAVADGTTWRGDVWLDAQALAALRAALPPKAAIEPPRWDALAVPCRVVHALAPVPAQRLLALRPHDIVVLGNRRAVAANLSLQAAGGGAAWRVVADGDGLRVLSRFTGTFHDSNDGASQMIPEATTPVSTDPLDTLRLDLCVELAALQMPLAELRALSAGDTLPLAIPLENARATLRVAGRVVGHGELVAAGEQLGVRVLALDPTRGA